MTAARVAQITGKTMVPAAVLVSAALGAFAVGRWVQQREDDAGEVRDLAADVSAIRGLLEAVAEEMLPRDEFYEWAAELKARNAAVDVPRMMKGAR